jgi:hypothetical protein
MNSTLKVSIFNLKIMKKIVICFLFVVFLLSCNEQLINDKANPVPSAEFNLNYPNKKLAGSDAKVAQLGFGYDANGFCDDVSIRERIMEGFQDITIIHYPTSTFANLFKANNFDELIAGINNQSRTAIKSHLRSLLKLADYNDKPDLNGNFVYFATTQLQKHETIRIFSDYSKYLTVNFKDDITALNAEELVSKYGTHVLTEFYTGMKFEVLYEFKSHVNDDMERAAHYFHKRMKEFAGGSPNMWYFNNMISLVANTKEKLIYNLIGNKEPVCNLITTSDYNPDNIRIDLEPVFITDNYRPQFIMVGERGLLPIYELIGVESKKLEVKQYVEKYMIE